MLHSDFKLGILSVSDGLADNSPEKGPLLHPFWDCMDRRYSSSLSLPTKMRYGKERAALKSKVREMIFERGNTTKQGKPAGLREAVPSYSFSCNRFIEVVHDAYPVPVHATDRKEQLWDLL
jgi:hypothetical protein